MLQAIFAQMLTPLSFMGFIMKELDEIRISLQYAMDLNKNCEKIDKNEISKSDFNFQGGQIEFRNVNFNYSTPKKNETKVILNDFNCVFEKGTKNAIVGYSGSGKSTIFNLIVTTTSFINLI